MTIKPESFLKIYRLSNGEEYSRVFQTGIRQVGCHFCLLGISNGSGLSRLGLAISKKCAKRAVDRNRIKRLTRETFRLSRDNLAGVDFVVICRASALDASNNLLTSSLYKQFRNVHHRLCGFSSHDNSHANMP